MKFHFGKTFYNGRKWTTNFCSQDDSTTTKDPRPLFQILSSCCSILDEYDFIIGLEAAIQLEAVYHMTLHVVNIQPRSVPLFSNKDIKISPGTSTSIQLTGDFLVLLHQEQQLLENSQRGWIFIQHIEVQFLGQSTCIHVSNKLNKPVYFYKDSPITYFDLRSIGYFNPSQAVDMLKMKTPHTYVTSFAALQDASNHRLDNNLTHVTDTQDPYPWLELDNPRRFQTDRQILESAVDLSQSCLTSAQKVEFFYLLEKYKDTICLRDEIGLAPHMQVHLDLTDKIPFFIRPFTVKEDMKSKIDKKWID